MTTTALFVVLLLVVVWESGVWSRRFEDHETRITDLESRLDDLDDPAYNARRDPDA